MRNIAAVLLLCLLAPIARADDRPRDRLGDQLFTAGATSFAISYSAMSVAGFTLANLDHYDVASDGARSFTPVVGPFWWAYDFTHIGGLTDVGRAVLGLTIVDGIVQVGGIGLMIAGGLHQRHVRAATFALR